MDQKEQLLQALLESAKNGSGSDGRRRLNCAEAFKLAEEYQVEIIEVGRICNQNDIRICKCQLGCFA